MGISRRDFFKHAGVSLAGLALSSCQQDNLFSTVPTLNLSQILTGSPTARVFATPHPTQTFTPTPTFHPSQIPELVSPQEADFLAAHEMHISDTSRPVIMMTYDDNGTYGEIVENIAEAG